MSGPLEKFGRIAAMLILGCSAGAALCPAAEWMRRATSAFLRASADSPVDWQPWTPAVLARAKRENRPVYVFIGSFLSELSRATFRQSFSNADAAAFLNANFVCVVVDQEERPDLAAETQLYLEEIKQLSGWPAHLWLTPELQPYEGASYLPPSEEWGKVSFIKTAQGAQSAWATDKAGCRRRGGEAVSRLAAAIASADGTTSAPAAASGLAAAAAKWQAIFDSAHGGFGDPPRSPEPELLRFLLRQSPADRAAALATLRAIAGSALRDPLDGGFFRNCSDASWRIPTMQKTLTDQARLALAFLDADRISGIDGYREAAQGALDCVLSRFALPGGTFAAAQDATREDLAGSNVWTEADIASALGKDAEAYERAHGVEKDGNISADDDPSGTFKGRNILRSEWLGDDRDAADSARLLALRNRRPAPLFDGRATAGAHGLLLEALARAGSQLASPRYLDAAARIFVSIKRDFRPSDGTDLLHLKDSPVPASPSDYAALALGCREFARAAHRPDADALANRLLVRSGDLYFDPASGRYLASMALPEPGIFARAPARGDPLRAEALALLAGAPPGEARPIANALWAGISESGSPASGDVLLSLVQ